MPILSIGESRPKKKKLFSSLIMMVEKTDHSHSFISYKDARLDKVRYVAEAKGSGCRVLSNHQFKKENHVVRIYQYEVSQEVLDDIHLYIHLVLARNYAFKQIIGLAYKRLFNAFGVKVKNPFKDGDYSLVCVEMSAQALFRAIKQTIPKSIEDYGLREMHELNMKHGKEVPQEKLDRINGVKNG